MMFIGFPGNATNVYLLGKGSKIDDPTLVALPPLLFLCVGDILHLNVEAERLRVEITEALVARDDRHLLVAPGGFDLGGVLDSESDDRGVLRLDIYYSAESDIRAVASDLVEIEAFDVGLRRSFDRR